ncbi:MAG: hypothetical protein GTN38_01035 [Candidatus Aenigmarchaeota archaeon]|nr:hypothetical protein [Candidatus Aenigmarchaeota archaeon]NIP40172.1 hypothetical protein [Candidatus Aenigmarchaeota archaeon]NIQ17216.1 hypothetical protein [Candidatus Aenigmarchaeota archaeon]NIS73006.1 hypothetical protein [Candidatus Aenigmarchaeota archaeon]
MDSVKEPEKFSEAMEDVLGEYILDFEDNAKSHLSELLRNQHNFDMTSLNDERKEDIFFQYIDGHSLSEYGFVYDDYLSMGNDLVGKVRKKRVEDFAVEFARKEAERKGEEFRKEDSEPESFTMNRDERTQYNFLEFKLKEMFGKEYGKEDMKDFEEFISGYKRERGIDLVELAKVIYETRGNFEEAFDHFYKTLIKEFGKPAYREPSVLSGYTKGEDKRGEEKKDEFEVPSSIFTKEKDEMHGEETKEEIVYKPEAEKKKKYRVGEGIHVDLHYNKIKGDDFIEGVRKSVEKTSEEIEKGLETLEGHKDESGRKRRKIWEYVTERAEKFEEKWDHLFKEKIPDTYKNVKNHLKKNKRKYLGGVGIAAAGVAALLLSQQACPGKKPEQVVKPPVPKVRKVEKRKAVIPEIRPSKSLLSSDIQFVFEDRSNWDILDPAEKSRKIGYDEKHYGIYTDGSLHGNVVSLIHGDATNKGEEVDYIGVKIGEKGKWVYLEPGSRFDMEVTPEEAEILRNGGKLEYQVVGLDKGKNGKHKVKVSYRNAKLQLSRDALRDVLMEDVASYMEGISKTGDKGSDLGVYALLQKEFKEAFHSYMDERRENGEDVSLLDNPLADFTGSIGEMYNEGIAPWKIGKEMGMSTQDVYKAISAARELGTVVRPQRYNAKLFREIFNPSYA